MGLILLAAAHAADSHAPNLCWSGTLDIDQTRVAFLVSGHGGGGTLHYQGRHYSFSIGGLGAGGIGISRLKASGQVYNMTDPMKFAGQYSEMHSGFATAGDGSSNLWLKNRNGVVLKLQGKEEDIALSPGADAVKISYR